MSSGLTGFPSPGGRVTKCWYVLILLSQLCPTLKGGVSFRDRGMWRKQSLAKTSLSIFLTPATEGLCQGCFARIRKDEFGFESLCTRRTCYMLHIKTAVYALTDLIYRLHTWKGNGLTHTHQKLGDRLPEGKHAIGISQKRYHTIFTICQNTKALNTGQRSSPLLSDEKPRNCSIHSDHESQFQA